MVQVLHERSRIMRYGWSILVCLVLAMSLMTRSTEAASYKMEQQLIPILGVTTGQGPTGTVAYLILTFEEREDSTGLSVQFKNAPGRFSRMAQTAVEQAIYRTARATGLSPDSWTVVLAVPYPHVTIYGESLSAMIGLTVLALARHEFIPPDRVITGTVTADGHIGSVGALQLKIEAASEAHLRRVLVPDELDISDGDWETPFLLQVSPVGSISQAYEALTDHPLLPQLSSR